MRPSALRSNMASMRGARGFMTTSGMRSKSSSPSVPRCAMSSRRKRL